MDNHITHHQDLSTEKQALLPIDSACEIELTDTDLETIYGGLGLPDFASLAENALGLPNPPQPVNPPQSANPAVNSSSHSIPQGFTRFSGFTSFVGN